MTLSPDFSMCLGPHMVERWKHAEEWLTFTEDTVEGFEFLQEVLICILSFAIIVILIRVMIIRHHLHDQDNAHKLIGLSSTAGHCGRDSKCGDSS